MDDRSQAAELGKAQGISHQAPHLGMRLGETEGVLAFAFPARSAREPLEAALPGSVELDQELRTDVARYVGEKRKLGTQRFQLADLIESIGIEAHGTPEAELSLL